MWIKNVKVILVQIALLVGLFVFARGFLPPTRTKLGLSTKEPNVPPQFDRLVLMVVDAMRSDFLFSENSHMYAAHEILRKGNGYGFTAFSDPPTVTLPRLKGITTGASSNFLDAVINVAESDSASTLENQDSWIEQLYSHNKTLRMYGDDTWLNSFPKKFQKYEGTSSFYVADFTEVDNNVTRHLEAESPSHEWDALISHYLGLDHIGHKGGPNSPHMMPKQEEMGEIVSRVYESLDDSTLFVLLGDHGMNDVGNHGGASTGETSAALALFSKKFHNMIDSPLPYNDDYTYYTRVRQVDLVPTLSFLSGFPIPKNSLGVFMSQFLPMWPHEDQQQILVASCEHLDLENCTWEGLIEQQEHLMRTSSEHVLSYMYIGIGILFFTTVVTAALCYNISRHLVTSLKEACLLSWWSILSASYFVGMMGSSTVEEEHYIWYWALGGIMSSMVIIIGEARSQILILLICFRIMRGWNTSGQKWTFLTDTADIVSRHPKFKVALVSFAFLFVATNGFKRLPLSPFIWAEAITFTIFKLNSDIHPVSLWWMIWLARAGAMSAMLEIIFGSNTEPALTLIGLMQAKQENAFLWVIFVIARRQLLRLNEIPGNEAYSLTLALISVCFEYVSFFAIGGSNSLASIDLSNAYNGVSGYNISVVAILTYLGNWSPALYFASVNFSPNQKIFRSLFYSVALLSIAVACFVSRSHLFIWTVFSPKLLYAGAWLVFHEILASNIVTTVIGP